MLPSRQTGTTSLGINLAGINLNDGQLSAQLRDGLRQGQFKKLNLFQEMDTDGSGKVSRSEFIEEMYRLGMDRSSAALRLQWYSVQVRRTCVVDVKAKTAFKSAPNVRR